MRVSSCDHKRETARLAAGAKTQVSAFYLMSQVQRVHEGAVMKTDQHTMRCFTVHSLCVLNVSACTWVCEQDEKKKKENKDPERGSEKAPLQEEKGPKVAQHMFLGRPLRRASAERRDTLAASCSPGLASHLSRWSFLAGAAIFISAHGK